MTFYGGNWYRTNAKVLNTLFGTPKNTAPIVDGPALLLRSIDGAPISGVVSFASDAGENLAFGTPTPISGALVPAGNGPAAFANVAGIAVVNSSNANLSRDGLSGGGTATTRTFTATLTLGAGNVNPFGVVQFYWVDPTGFRRFIGNAVTVTNPVAGTWTFAMTWNPSNVEIPESIEQITFAPLVGGGVVAVGVDNASVPATGRFDALSSPPSTAFTIVR
jgi:hypothetical protein